MTEQAAEPLLKTKLFIPQVRHEVVRRPRLISRMNAGIQRALTLVSAPAGFGKTTALAEWADQLQVPVAWLSLDEGDNDLARFFAYLTAALQTALPRAGEAALMAFRSPQPPPVESVLAALINEIAAGTVSFALILDDYHVIKARPVHNAITFLIDYMPAQMHLIIATRSDPPLPLARWRSRGQLVEVRADDLRFTPDEATTFLNQVMGLGLSEADIAVLEERTEGWIVGLQMAALSMQGREDIAAFIRSFSGSHRYILDYLVEEVLNLQSDNIQTFLLQTCILGRLCGPLCDAILGVGAGNHRSVGEPLLTPAPQLPGSPAQEILEYLDRSNLFTVPLDDERRWYRYHHLFAELLRARLTQSYGDQHVEILHTRAAGWYEVNGFPAEAIQHALAAQDYERAARLIENISESAWLNGEFYRLLGWIEALPGEVIRNHPWLCIWYTWALLQSGLVQRAEALINDVERISENQLRGQPAKPSPDTQALMDQIATLQVVSASCLRQDPGKTIELASRALERSPVENRMASFIARCEVLYNLGFAYYLTGELSKAERTYQEAKMAARQIGFLLRDILVTHKLANIHQVIGRLHQPYHLYQETLAFMQKQGKQEFFGMGYLYCGMSNLLYEWNRLEEAQQMVAESLRLNEMTEVPHLLIDSYNAQARLLITQRDLVAAQTALQKAADLIQKYYCWPEVIGANESYQVRLWLAKGDLTSAIRWIQERQLAESEALSLTQELGEIARARILIAQGLLNEATGLLSRLAKSAETGGRNGRLIEILVLEAVARQAGGDLKQAIATLEQALSLAEPEGYIRTFVDEGAPVAALLSEIIGNRRSPHAPYVHLLLAAFGIEVDDQGRTVRMADSSRSIPTLRPSPWVEPLSERELEVLQCIAAGLSNAEIAQQLVIAVSTVKRHINHIFGKLGATSRTQALVKAKELGLL